MLLSRRTPDGAGFLPAIETQGRRDADNSLSSYSELLEIGLGDTPARDIWRNLMAVGTYFPGRGTLVETTFLEGEAKGEAKGRAEGKAESVLRVLAARGVEVPEATARRVLECTDSETLDRWLDRAVTAAHVEELFTPEA